MTAMLSVETEVHYYSLVPMFKILPGPLQETSNLYPQDLPTLIATFK